MPVTTPNLLVEDTTTPPLFVLKSQKSRVKSVGITLNALYINPRQFGFQFPLWQETCREGLPIEGFCVAASIATTKKAAEIAKVLKASGIKAHRVQARFCRGHPPGRQHRRRQP